MKYNLYIIGIIYHHHSHQIGLYGVCVHCVTMHDKLPMFYADMIYMYIWKMSCISYIPAPPRTLMIMLSTHTYTYMTIEPQLKVSESDPWRQGRGTLEPRPLIDRIMNKTTVRGQRNPTMPEWCDFHAHPAWAMTQTMFVSYNQPIWPHFLLRNFMDQNRNMWCN